MNRLLLFILGLFLSLLTGLSPSVYAIGHQQESPVYPPSSLDASPIAWIKTSQQYYQAGQFHSAVTLLEDVAAVYRTRGDRFRLAQTLRLKALSLQALDQWQLAEDVIAQSLSLLDTDASNTNTSNTSTHTRRLRAQLLIAQGQGNLAIGQAQQALERWQAAEVDYAAIDDEEGVWGSQLNQATALQVLGFYQQARQQFEQMEAQLEGQLEAQLETSQQEHSPSLLTVHGLLSLGNILQQYGELERSRQLLQTSLTLVKNLPDSDPRLLSQIHLSLANTDRGLAQRAQRYYDPHTMAQYRQTAAEHYIQAAELATSSMDHLQAQLNQLSLWLDTLPIIRPAIRLNLPPLPNTHHSPRNHSNPSVHERAAILAAAETLIPQITEQLQHQPPSRATVDAHVNFARSLMTLAQVSGQSRHRDPVYPDTVYPDIHDLLQRAIRQARTLHDHRALTYALGTLGQWQEQQQQWSEAIATTRMALDMAIALKADDITYQWQWQLGRLLYQKDGPNALPSAISHYTTAVDRLQVLRSDLMTLSPDMQFEFRAHVEPVYRQLVDILLQAPTPEHLAQARDVMESLQLAELDNFFRDACAKPRPVNVDAIDPHAAILYPIILGDRLELLLQLPGESTLHHYTHAHLPAPDVDQTVNTLLAQLKRRSSDPESLQRTSQQIYQWLIQPFETELETHLSRDESTIKTLTFVLDGTLRNVPMAALHDGQRYLVERYAIALTPSLQLFDPAPLPHQTLKVLLAGADNAPSFQQANLTPLHHVARELDGIQATVPRHRRLDNEQFLRQNITRRLNRTPFNIVHLATHGQFSANPEQTFLLDWQGRIPMKDIDQLLFLQDPQRAVKDPIELLILSACKTATGDNHAALGLAGLALRAGARSTLATLWTINDASTAEFMVNFYRHLADHPSADQTSATQPSGSTSLSKAEALRNAQLEFLHRYPDTDYRRPYHWAPFILVGNWL